MEENKKRKFLFVLGPLILFIALTTVTYSFFNYTRTGGLNNLGTGRIYFNSDQNGSLNITNVFPMTSTQASNAQLDSVTVGIVGDTTYENGEEFEITLVDVTNTINGKQIPINYIATYVPTTGNSIGASSDTYWESRNSKNADIYTLTTTGEVEEGKQVLVGFIKNSVNGINGTLTIKAYIDEDRIAISDTYSEGTVRNVITTGYSSSNCETTLTGVANASTYCASASSLQEAIDNEDLTSEQITLLVNAGIVEEYTNGTTSNWVNERTVFTTTEWNSFQSSGSEISFKIRAESNEGIWVIKPSKGIESCPDCKFMYIGNTPMYTTWNSQSETPTVLTSGLYDNYEELIATTGKNYFLGVKLNNNNEVTNAHVCGVKGNVPFCLEGKLNSGLGGTEAETTYATNKTLLQGTSLYNNTCTVEGNPEYTLCGPWNNSNSISSGTYSDGHVTAGVGYDDYCNVYYHGGFGCYESNSGGNG